tara:strand:+ start:451 stop:819 length:369 start_codon:yes stop_codon:yes gene_type:complete
MGSDQTHLLRFLAPSLEVIFNLSHHRLPTLEAFFCSLLNDWSDTKYGLESNYSGRLRIVASLFEVSAITKNPIIIGHMGCSERGGEGISMRVSTTKCVCDGRVVRKYSHYPLPDTFHAYQQI